MKGHGKDNQRDMDGREVFGQPGWKVDVGDGSCGVSEIACDRGQRAVKTVGGEDQCFQGHEGGCESGSPIRAFPDA